MSLRPHLSADNSSSEASVRFLRESDVQFQLMADSVPHIVWITDARGRVEYFNKYWRDYTGLQFDPATAAEVAAASVHPDDAALTMERFIAVQASGEPFEVEHRILSAQGTYRW